MLLQPVRCLYNCSSEYQRTPENSDLMVQCGTSKITLDINLCTVQWAGFNATELALNGQYSNTACQGSVDTSVNPPVVHFQLPVNQSQDNSCRQSLQAVIVTGYINTPRSDQGLISYSTDLYYHFSCRYPLQYLLNNTQITASSVSVATSNNNGTFIDSLKMSVFNDSNYNYPLVVPPTGLELRTKLYVEVKFQFTLGSLFCYSNSLQYTTDCNIANRTTVTSNGVSTVARFNFEAFRFVQHHDQAKSSIYVHCMLRLCEPSKCQQIQNFTLKTYNYKNFSIYSSPICLYLSIRGVWTDCSSHLTYKVLVIRAAAPTLLMSTVNTWRVTLMIEFYYLWNFE
uniref:Si:dkey-103g5.3 n=1 Tax=Pundamilia nyererei TaxID=303518 RepID=A0A3B4GQH9_9CICH